jgi:hypothetical protein
MNAIPVMTDPLGRHWRQPDRSRILTDDTHAVMTRQDFFKLSDYSTTYPSGVYDGKMWRRRQGFDWLLCWYGPCENPKLCSINARVVILVD